MGLFSSPKIDGNELQDCLACFEAQSRVIAFQTKEADLYNNAMVKYGDSISNNPSAAKQAVKAAKRLSEAANEVIRRHNQIQNVPDVASAMHYAWYVTFMANAAWASATASAIAAMAEGLNANTIYIQQLVQEYQKAWGRADKEDKKFLKRLKVNAEDIAEIITRATNIESTNDWEP
jgi:predicted transposase YbfD/YdcC